MAVDLVEKLKRPLRTPYYYLSFRVKALRLKLQEWNTSNTNLPIPPPLLRFRVHGALDSKSYLQVGQICAQNIKDLLRTVGKDFYSFNNVLDFGCGSGRTLRFFHDRPDSCHLFGTDIDKQAISWCRKHLDVASWSTNNHLPPLTYADNTFDLIYSISVFTHLDEQMQFVWLDELKRISKKGGILILSVHGETTQSNLSEELKTFMSEKGFLYRVNQTGMFKWDGLPDFYQTTYHSRWYVEDRWSKFFKVVGYQERGINSFQDAVILLNES